MNSKRILVGTLVIVVCLALIFIFFNMHGYSVFEGNEKNNQEISGVRISMSDSSIRVSSGEDLELKGVEEDER